MPSVISHLVIDCAEPERLARWWAQVLAWHVLWDPDPDDSEVLIAPTPDATSGGWLFARVPEPKSVKNRLHVDVRPPNGSTQAAELERLVELGATPVDVGQGDVTWHVLADPEGNEFCLLRSTPDEIARIIAEQRAAAPG